MPTLRELAAHLNEYIIGQERVKKTLAVAVVNHYNRSAARSASPISRVSRSPRAMSS